MRYPVAECDLCGKVKNVKGIVECDGYYHITFHIGFEADVCPECWGKYQLGKDIEDKKEEKFAKRIGIKPNQDPREDEPVEQKCRVCGCTQSHACLGGCYWVEPDLCSQCVGEPERPKDEVEVEVLTDKTQEIKADSMDTAARMKKAERHLLAAREQLIAACETCNSVRGNCNKCTCFNLVDRINEQLG